MDDVVIKQMESGDWWRFVKVMRNHRVKKTITFKELFKTKMHWAKGFFILMTHWRDYFYKIEYKGKFAGFIIITMYWHIEEKNEYDYDKGTVYYGILPGYSGKGIATRALAQLLAIYDNSKDERKIYGMTHDFNVASQKVLERNGFSFVYFEESMPINSGQRLFVR